MRSYDRALFFPSGRRPRRYLGRRSLPFADDPFDDDLVRLALRRGFALPETAALLDLADLEVLTDFVVRSARVPDDLDEPPAERALRYTFRASDVRDFVAGARGRVDLRDLRLHLETTRTRHRALVQVVADLQGLPTKWEEASEWPEPERGERIRRPLDRATIVARLETAMPGWPDPRAHVDAFFRLSWYELRDGCFTPQAGTLAPWRLAGILRLP